MTGPEPNSGIEARDTGERPRAQARHSLPLSILRANLRYVALAAVLAALVVPAGGPVRAVVLFVGLLAIPALIVGAILLFIPDSSGNTGWGGRRKRR